MSNKIYSFLGLTKKAGKLFSGEDTCERLISSGNVFLIIVAEDASANTKKKFIDACKYKNIEIRFFGTKELIGRYTGKEIRAVVSIVEKGFANRLIEMMNGSEYQDGGEQVVKG